MISSADLLVIERMLGCPVSGRVIAATGQLVAFLEADDEIAALSDRDMAHLTVISAYVFAAVALTMAPPIARDGLPAQPAATPSAVWLGQAPEIGRGHEAAYTQVAP